MKIPGFDVDGFLDEPGRSAQVASVSPAMVPLLGSLWFLFENERFWFMSAQASPLAMAAARGDQIAVIVDDFSPPRSIRQVRIRGRGSVERHNQGMVRRIYERYLGEQEQSWPPFFRDRMGLTDGWTLWSVNPESGIAVTSPDFFEAVYRWNRRADAPFSQR